MTALLHQESRPNYDYGVSDLSAGVRTTFIYVILWGGGGYQILYKMLTILLTLMN